MEEIVALVVKKTGVPKETAQQIVKIVLDYLKKKLPAPLGSQLDAFLKNGSTVATAGKLLGDLTATLGKKKKYPPVSVISEKRHERHSCRFCV